MVWNDIEPHGSVGKSFGRTLDPPIWEEMAADVSTFYRCRRALLLSIPGGTKSNGVPDHQTKHLSMKLQAVNFARSETINVPLQLSEDVEESDSILRSNRA
jgi:hypothetical protein